MMMVLYFEISFLVLFPVFHQKGKKKITIWVSLTPGARLLIRKKKSFSVLGIVVSDT